MSQEGPAFIEFLNKCGSPYHASEAAVGLLDGAEEYTNIGSGAIPVYGYHIVAGTTVIGWRRPAGGQFRSILILASHTDSPCLRSRPRSRLDGPAVEMFGVDTYGGGLWHTWFDRALAVAGCVHIDNGSAKLVKIDKPVAIIPNLCIHLQDASEREAFKVNAENHLRPIVASKLEKATGSGEAAGGESGAAGGEGALGRWGKDTFVPSILEHLAEQYEIKPDSVTSWDLCLYDATPARLSGIKSEFVDAPGLDNKTSLFANFRALNRIVTENLCPDTLVIAIGFDHEEIGSRSTRGADSNILRDWIELLDVAGCLRDQGQRMAIQANSILLSCDAAHALHPNYQAKHQNQHAPLMGKGTVIKINANQRYATTAHHLGAARQLAEQFDTPIQEFVVRNDSRCGSTIGPMSAAMTGIDTLDCGLPMLAMHSARELCHQNDVGHLVDFCLAWAKSM